MNKDLLKTTLVVSNVFNGERKEKTILCISEELAVKKAERISEENPDCVVSISSKEGMFFYLFKPLNMTRELELVSQGRMDTIDYILKWTGLSANLQPEKKTKPRRQKPGQAPSIENFQQAAGV
jgi:hypothetical protein